MTMLCEYKSAHAHCLCATFALAWICYSGTVRYALGWRGGAWYARRAFRREQQKLMMGHMKSQGRWHWRPFNRLKNRLRRASKNKSEDAQGLAQSTDAPSSSGASANISNTAQPAAGSAWAIYIDGTCALWSCKCVVLMLCDRSYD
jgi:hypothetical protein